MDSLDDVFDRIAKDATEKAASDAKKAADLAISKALPIAAEKMYDIFNNAIADFYTSYSRIKRNDKYLYVRNMSLFGIFNIRATNDSIIVNEDEDAVTPWHIGGSAANFDAAYIHGIHGRPHLTSTPPEQIYDNAAGKYWENEVGKMIEEFFSSYWNKIN